MTSLDQHEMLSTKETTVNLMNRIATKIDNEVKPTANTTFVFVGTPADNSLFNKDSLCDKSNDYSHYGSFWLGGDCITQSYYGFLRDCGLNYKYENDFQKYHEISDSEQAISMPAYPADGCIQMIDGYCVVKLS